MDIPPFQLERLQSIWENVVDYNLSESGVHPLSLAELFESQPDRLAELLKLELGYSQTNGTIALRERIAALYQGATADQVLVTNGTSEANFVTVWSLLEPGDELVVMLPNYMQIHGLVGVWNGRVRAFNLRSTLDWGPDLDELRGSITSRTKAIAICNPNNPTGAVLSPEARRVIVETAAKVGAWIISDEVYQGAEHNGEITPSLWGEGYERVIVTNGLSKAYGLPGLRIGWIVSSASVAARLWSYRDYTTISPGTLSDQIAQHVLEPATRARILGRTRFILNSNFELVREFLNRHRDILALINPRAGAIALIKNDLPIGSEELVERVRRIAGVLVVPGAHFGLEGFFRLGYGGRKDHVARGLQRLSESLDAIGGEVKASV